MPLPTSRDFDAVDAGPLPAATLNAIQDGIVNLDTSVRGPITHNDMAENMNLGHPSIAGLAGNNGMDIVFVSGSNKLANLAFPDLKVGDRLLSWKMIVRGIGTGTHKIDVSLVRYAGIKIPPVTVAVGSFENVPGQATQTYINATSTVILTSAAALPVAITDDYLYGFRISSTAGSGDDILVHSVQWVTDHP